MGSITGAATVIGLKKATTWGTATAIGSGDKVEVESLNQAENAEELTANPIGAGTSMATESRRGATSPTVEIETLMGYDNSALVAVGQFFGTDTVNEEPGGSGDYLHSFMFNETRNQAFVTAAFQAASAVAGSIEFPSCVTTRVQITAENPPNYTRLGLSLLANEQELASATNTYTSLNSATVANSQRIVLQPDDQFLINAQGGGALSGSDKLNITSIDIALEYDQGFVAEIKGSLGNGTPVAVGDPPFQGTVTIRLKELSDLTYFTAAQAGTEYKAMLDIQDDTSPYRMRVYFPRLKIVEDPEYNLTTTATNEHVITFKCLAAASNPTGMVDTTPFIVIKNEQSGAYI